LVQIEIRLGKTERMRPVVRPLLILLDEQHQEIARFAPEQFDYQPGEDEHTSVLRITPGIARARFAVLASNPASFGRARKRNAKEARNAPRPARVWGRGISSTTGRRMGPKAGWINFDARPGYLQRRAEGPL